MRERPAPCINATLYEFNNGKHMTWNDNLICADCERVQDLFAQRRAINEAQAEEPQA